MAGQQRAAGIRQTGPFPSQHARTQPGGAVQRSVESEEDEKTGLSRIKAEKEGAGNDRDPLCGTCAPSPTHRLTRPAEFYPRLPTREVQVRNLRIVHDSSSSIARVAQQQPAGQGYQRLGRAREQELPRQHTGDYTAERKGRRAVEGSGGGREEQDCGLRVVGKERVIFSRGVARQTTEGWSFLQTTPLAISPRVIVSHEKGKEGEERRGRRGRRREGRGGGGGVGGGGHRARKGEVKEDKEEEDDGDRRAGVGDHDSVLLVGRKGFAEALGRFSSCWSGREEKTSELVISQVQGQI
eukprot:546567-Hanusia_phi.AAC.3